MVNKYNEIYVYDGNSWILEKRDKTIDKIYDTCSFKLYTWLDDVTGETEIGEGIKVNLINEDDIEDTIELVNEKRNLLATSKDKKEEVRMLITNKSNNMKNPIKAQKQKF